MVPSRPSPIRPPWRSASGAAAVALLWSLWGLGMGDPVPPARAHQVQVGDGVGATLHIEPNDIPRAGVPAPVWFALTQPGGVVIPLEDCACELTLVADDGRAIASPPLRAVTAEGYEDIPGAQVTFPEVGRYTLVLTGEPVAPAPFAPFNLTFEVTVAAAARRASAPEPAPESVPEPAPGADGDPPPTSETSGTAAPSSSSDSAKGWIGGVAAILLTGAVGLVVYRRRSPGAKS
jgi:hypothetical protein